MKIKKLIKRIIFPNSYSSEAFVKYLRNRGINVGDETYFWSPNKTFIDVQRPCMISIGRGCKITEGVKILAHDYSIIVTRRIYNTHTGNAKKTIIGDNVFIGMNAIILMGAHIGDNCIVAAGSVVTKKFPDNCVIAGNPARIICTLDEYFQKHKDNEYTEAVEFAKEFYYLNNRVPNILDMGNAFAWMYLPRNEETIREYNQFFYLSGENYQEVVEDFRNSKGKFNSFESFIKSIKF